MRCWLDLSKGKSGLWPNSWGKYRHLLPCHYTFHFAASLHDIAYTRGSTQLDKDRADREFLENMKLENPKKIVCIYVYYYLVRLFWKYYFNYKWQTY